MTGRISPHQVALACGTGGAYVDVTSYVEFGETLTYGYGRSDQFSDVTPGTFTVVLNNSDGRFTPGNTNPFGIPLVEGMGVSWLLGTRLVHTTILSFEVPADESRWDQMVLHCDDMLGNAGRYNLTNLPDMLAFRLGVPPLMWRMDESDGSHGSLEASGNLLGAFYPTRHNAASSGQYVTYGVQQAAGLPGAAVTLTAAPGETVWYGTAHGNQAIKTTIGYPKVTASTSTSSQPSFGWWGFWVYPGSTITFALTWHWAAQGRYSDAFQVQVTPTTLSMQGGTNVGGKFTHTWSSTEAAAPHYIAVNPVGVWQTSASGWALFAYLFMDGTYLGTTYMQSSNPAYAVAGQIVPAAMLADGTAMQPVEVAFTIANGGSSSLSGTVQRVTHTLGAGTLEQNALYNSEDQRRAVVDFIDPTISSATWSGTGSQPLSTALVGFPDISNRSALDVYNDIVRTEAGHLFCTTSGTLLNPTEQIQLRARDRPQTPKVTFDVSGEGDGVPALIRDLTNVIESLDVQGPNQTVTVSDTSVSSVTTRFITSGQSETILSTDLSVMQAWGYDRINRAKNVAINVKTFAVENFTLDTDRSADLLGLLPGDRVRLTGFPAGRLGFATWDGWVIAIRETHSQTSDRFELDFAPCLPAQFLLDTDPLTNGGDITLTAAVGLTDTTLQVASATGQTFYAPCECTLGTAGEHILITAATATTLTVVRGYNGTTARTHTTAAPIEVVPVHQIAF